MKNKKVNQIKLKVSIEAIGNSIDLEFLENVIDDSFYDLKTMKEFEMSFTKDEDGICKVKYLFDGITTLDK